MIEQALLPKAHVYAAPPPESQLPCSQNMATRPAIEAPPTNKSPKHPSRTAHTPPSTPPSTPTPISHLSTAHTILSEMTGIHASLSNFASLAPRPEVNAVLTRLVGLCIQPHSEELVEAFWQIEDEVLSGLREMCAVAEGELEGWWAGRIVALLGEDGESVCATSTTTRNFLATFPYYGNYLDLCRLECNLLEAFPLPTPTNAATTTATVSPKRIAFIGSGPLPLSSFCIADRYPDAVVHNIDRDTSALAISEALARRLGYGGRMQFACRDVTPAPSDRETSGDGDIGVVEEQGGQVEGTDRGWGQFDIVFLAALVGMDIMAKMDILASLGAKLKGGTLVVVRSARGLREVLYPVFKIDAGRLQKNGFEVLAEVHPWTEVVNSVVVLRVRECRPWGE